MSTSCIANLDITQRMRESVLNAGIKLLGSLIEDDPLHLAGIQIEESQYLFDQVLLAHREQWPNRKVQFLERLCFPLHGTSDAQGKRHVLWRPLAQLFEVSNSIEIEDWMCQGEVALVYLKDDVARLAERIYPYLELARQQNPFYEAESGLQLMAHVLLDFQYDLEQANDFEIAKVVDEMRRHFMGHIRSHHRSGNLREALTAALQTAPEWAIAACLEFINSIDKEENGEYSPAFSLSLASEGSLSQDWLRPEEEAAWSYLREVK